MKQKDNLGIVPQIKAKPPLTIPSDCPIIKEDIEYFVSELDNAGLAPDKYEIRYMNKDGVIRSVKLKDIESQLH